MRMTIGSVMDDINEWQGPNGAVYYVTAFFTNSEMLSCGKKNMDAALEVRGLLQEVIEVPQEFILEPKGQTKKGAAKWNLKAFGPPEGVWTYSTIKGGQPEVGAGEQTPVTSGAAVPTVAGSGASAPTNNVAGAPERTQVHSEGRPAPGPSPSANNVEASIRASVALKAAVQLAHATADGVLATADKFDAWLAKKSSGVTPQGSPEETAPAASTVSRDQTGEGAGQGEGPAPSSKTNWQERVKDWPDPSENPI